jgi:predicted MarR family transcription regulator
MGTGVQSMFLKDEGLNDIMGLDEHMEQFMAHYVNSFIKWELVNYFHEHPRTSFKVADLAKALNRPAEPLKHELQELADEGLLRETKNAKKMEYLYQPELEKSRDRELSERLTQFVHLCRTREGRLRVIYKILKNGKPIIS